MRVIYILIAIPVILFIVVTSLWSEKARRELHTLGL